MQCTSATRGKRNTTKSKFPYKIQTKGSPVILLRQEGASILRMHPSDLFASRVNTLHGTGRCITTGYITSTFTSTLQLPES